MLEKLSGNCQRGCHPNAKVCSEKEVYNTQGMSYNNLFIHLKQWSYGL